MNKPKSNRLSMCHAVAMAGALGLAGITSSAYAATNVPTDLPPSPLFGATEFSQQMLRFEEFGVHPLPAPGSTTAKSFPAPTTCDGRPAVTGANGMDAFLDAPLWPDPTEEANDSLDNPWATLISGCIGRAITGVIEGRPPGEDFAHQRWDEFPPQVAFQTAMGGSRVNGGIRDDEQSHVFSVGEFGPGGLYHNVVGGLFPDKTFNGIAIKFHPSMPEQDPKALWTFGDGTLPPKLLMARYGIPILLRHYNALPIDVAANLGFGEHTITTHEHNGHQPGESDGYAWAFFFPGQFYDNRWPMQLAGRDSINTDATDPRASTPCSPGETLMITLPASGNPGGGVPVPKTCDPDTHTVNIPGDWHEIMSTHWFHDHMIDRTAQNVYKGNAAMMNYYSGVDRGQEGFRCNYADPKNNVNLCFPSGTALDWGNRDYDVQLLVADKAWTPGSGQLDFAPLNTDGFLGDRNTVNWLWNPYLDVRARRYRFRILNGSVSRFYKIAIVREYDDDPGTQTGEFAGPAGSNKSYDRIPFHMIANDGNIMEHAVSFPNEQSQDLPVQAIAERYDIIIDFSQFPVGTKLYMVNTLTFDNGRGPKDIIPLADILSGAFTPVIAGGEWSDDPAVGKFLEFRVQAYSGTDLSMNPADYEVGKKMMIPLVRFTDAELAAAKHRTFVFGRSGGNDGKPWTTETDGGPGLTATLGIVSAAPETMGDPQNGIPTSLEIWHIRNGGGGWAHPIHVHFEEGQMLLRGNTIFGVDVNHHPPLWEIGARKDMYRISDLGLDLGIPDSSMNITVAIRFREFAGTFVEHCHNTQHEDTAMLLRWDNEHPGQTVRIQTPIPDWDGVGYIPTNSLPTVKTGDTRPATLAFQAPLQLTADINNDTVVNNLDVGFLKSSFLFQGPWAADINGDEVVNNLDVGGLKSQFLQTTGFPLPPPLP
jgi:FtsP/CotA-like multicopper oxidase with cupredoxin domain